MDEYIYFLKRLNEVKNDIDSLIAELNSKYGDKKISDVISAHKDIPSVLESAFARLINEAGNTKLKDLNDGLGF
ncbi:exonuclease sbcc, putative (plasmid) [Phocaeicola salanitronis DSM 18170]|uniref:Exonuclease sbcc, putative n=1 Tax=Phocaeicola salanitronis (strain DSM 18170 / JCM 13657 / CCUG 60908 / BL78) TaxID=667015 RepID=F0R995_PHOSB|nr:hypothetical protein [Phocaeicola salanitronis]ADY38216.1 exonuclease sbcc, putative [Phocaeicola salanitronis DSM 18170]